jgi:4-hydroxy-2-oxoheptanedioate aldolase
VTVRNRWADGETAYGAWCMSGSPLVAEMLGLEGFHYVCLDLSTRAAGLRDLCRSHLCARAHRIHPDRAGPVSRQRGHRKGAGRWRGRGHRADGRACPAGRSGGHGLQVLYAGPSKHRIESRRVYVGNDPQLVNREVLCLVMIETALGVRNVQQICSVRGVDGVYVGPGHLAITLGLQPTLRPQPDDHADSIERVRATCVAQGIIAGIRATAALPRSSGRRPASAR